MKLFYAALIFVLFFLGCAKTPDKDYIKSADENLTNGNVKEAIKDLESFIEEFKDSEKTPEALSKLALIYQNKIAGISEKESLEKAVKLYRQVYDEYPNSSQAPTSLFMAAFILANELNKLHPAEMTYKLFLEKFPNHELAASAKEELNNLGLSPEEILQKKTTPNI